MTNAESSDSVATVAESGAPVASKKAAAKTTTRRKKGALRGQKAAASTKSKKAKTAQKAVRPGHQHPQSKASQILELIGRTKGSTLAEIMHATSWQAHSVRGFISTAGKKHGVKIDSSKTEAGERLYRLIR
jgi:hypothetical protein